MNRIIIICFRPYFNWIFILIIIVRTLVRVDGDFHRGITLRISFLHAVQLPLFVSCQERNRIHQQSVQTINIYFAV